ncbi:MAG: hypothetical protein OXB86_03080 [Bdellovibrionales bacterium]|nr:hypothetical protein [Bdellovibrionales bacterium]
MKYILLLTCFIMGHHSWGNSEFQCETIGGQSGYEYLKAKAQTSLSPEIEASVLRRLAKCQLDRRYNEVSAALGNLRKASSIGDVSSGQALGDYYRLGGTNAGPVPVNRQESIKWYEDVLQKINRISDYPNNKLISLSHNEIAFKTYPDTLLQLTHLYTSEYYHKGFSLYNKKSPSNRDASELRRISQNNLRLLQEAEAPLNRCLTDTSALVFEQRARQLSVQESELRKYNKYQSMVREGLCPLYRTLLDKAHQMEETIYNEAPLCSSAGSSSASCQAMDREVDAFNQAVKEYLEQYKQIRDACNCS